ncbi:TPA: hypothetical protein HA273_01000 [Candidatus Bathyarchaeota archaeon]|nr:hypothetical protein [Candidatus Bathyarchaeota archaeon]HIJ08697.1 hypothetical protein [Candidatus Bathyarchaeota archaeon]
MLTSLLKMTKKGCVSIENLKRGTRLSPSILASLLGELKNKALVCVSDDMVCVDPSARVQIALRALLLGADFEVIAALLQWQEFENIAGATLEVHGYSVQRNFRFKEGGKRWEIDIVACREPIVVCLDCKQWKRTLSPSSSKRIVEAQTQRTKALASILPSASLRLECQKWRKANFVPAVLSLIPGGLKFCNKVPIVPILQLQDFVRQLPAQILMLQHTQRNFDHLGHEFQN